MGSFHKISAQITKQVRNFFSNKSPLHDFLDRTILRERIFVTYEDALRAYQGLTNFCEKNLTFQLTDCKKMLEGLSRATVFEFRLSGRHFVARLLEQQFDLQVLKHEIEAQNKAASLGLAPAIAYHDYTKGLVVMSYIEGGSLEKRAHCDLTLEKCAQALKKLHGATLIRDNALLQNDLCVYKENKIGFYAQFCLRSCYEYKFPRSSILTMLQDFAAQLSDVANQAPHQKSLVHNDAHCGNIFIDSAGCVKIIDWADAGYDNPLNDCAILINEYAEPTTTNIDNFRYYYFSDKHRQKFLTHYLGRSPSLQESAWFRILIHLYRLEMMSKILADPYAITASKGRPFQDALYQSIEKYMHNEFVDEQLAAQSGLMICAIKEWVEGIKRYMSDDFLKDKELILKD